MFWLCVCFQYVLYWSQNENKGDKNVHNKNKKIRVVDENYSPDPRIPNVKRKRVWKKSTVLFFGGLLLLALVIFGIIYFKTYTSVRVSETYTLSGAANSSYEPFAKGVLKYSRDGVAYVNEKGEELWNQSCQLKTPIVKVTDECAAIADEGGNDIYIFDKDGEKGEVHTTLPIEKIAVSGQGIVSAIVKNESSPEIVCYDTAGNLLVEHQASLDGTGYPLDVSLSEDGEVMQVVYMNVQGGKLLSKVAYYNFGSAGESTKDHEVTKKEYKNSILAEGFYMKGNISAVIGDNCLTLFKGKTTPKEVNTVTIKKQIQSIAHSQKYIGMMLKNAGKNGYELRLYNTAGKKVLSKEIKENYRNIRICGNQVILYDGKKCSIYLKNGIHKFEGAMEDNILEMLPIFGVNKYIVLDANGMDNIRLVR